MLPLCNSTHINMWIELYFEHWASVVFLSFSVVERMIEDAIQFIYCAIFRFAFLWENLQFSHTHKCGYISLASHRNSYWTLWTLFEVRSFLSEANWTKENSPSNRSFWIGGCRLFSFHKWAHFSFSKEMPSIVSICENVTQFTHLLKCNFAISFFYIHSTNKLNCWRFDSWHISNGRTNCFGK